MGFDKTHAQLSAVSSPAIPRFGCSIPLCVHFSVTNVCVSCVSRFYMFFPGTQCTCTVPGTLVPVPYREQPKMPKTSENVTALFGAFGPVHVSGCRGGGAQRARLAAQHRR